jgi:hypothetical protein
MDLITNSGIRNFSKRAWRNPLIIALQQTSGGTLILHGYNDGVGFELSDRALEVPDLIALVNLISTQCREV